MPKLKLEEAERRRYLIELGARIEEARKLRGYTRPMLALEANTCRKAVWEWERGKTEPKASQVKLIARALDVSPRWLLCGPKDHPGDVDLSPGARRGKQERPA